MPDEIKPEEPITPPEPPPEPATEPPAPEPPEEPAPTAKETKAWEKLRKLIEAGDKKGLQDLKIEGTRIVQEGVTVEEVKKQILDLAPGKHTSLNGLVLDLIEKL